MTEIRRVIAVAGVVRVLAVLKMRVQVAFLDGVIKCLPEMRQAPTSRHVRVPFEKGTTNDVSNTFRRRVTLVALTVKPAWAATDTAVGLFDDPFSPTTTTLYARPFTSLANLHEVDVVVHFADVPSAIAV